MRAALAPGAAGTVDDYAAFGGEWGFELASVAVPVTVWHGQEDRLVPMGHARRLAAALPHSRLEIVGRAGHFLPALIG